MSTTAHPTVTRGASAEHRDAVATFVIGVQAAALVVAAISVFAGIGVGSTALRIGMGALFLALGLGAAGIALGLNEGQPSARVAALVFESFALALALLSLAPTLL